MSEHKIPEEALRQLCAGVDGDCGLYVSVPGEGLKFSINENRIFNAASTIKIPVHQMEARSFGDGYAVVNLTLDVNGMEQLDFILNKLRAVPGVMDVKRQLG